MKILITGAAGAIGSHLAEALVSQGHEVIGVDALTDYYSPALKEITIKDIEAKGVRFHRKDLVTDDIQEILDGVEIIYHLAAQPGISSETPFDIYVRNNILATECLLDATKNLSSLKGFINVSTSSVYGAHATGDENLPPTPTSHYGVTKLAAEQLVLARQREKKFPALSCRLFSVYGERERPEKLYYKLIKSILEGKEFPLFEGSRDHLRSFTYVGDIVEGLILVLENLEKCIGEVINLGSDTVVSTGEGIQIIEELLEQKALFKEMSKRPGDQMETSANINKARLLLGYKPKTELREGLKKQVDWYLKKIHNRK